MEKLYHALRNILINQDGGPQFFVVVLCTLIFSILLSGPFYRFFVFLISKILKGIKVDINKESFSSAKKPTQLLFISTMTYLAIYFTTSRLSLSNSSYLVISVFTGHLFRATTFIAVAWLFFHIIPILYAGYLRLNPNSMLEQNPIVRVFVIRATQMVSLLISFIALLSEFGINVNGLITGLGLGGLTFALAAQDTASNVFGGIVILSDKPFSIGDWIQTPEAEGIVEDITFRSTRIRTFDDALIVLPNSKLSNSAITNWAKMNKRRMKFYIGLTYSTNPNDLRKIVEMIEQCLKNHPEISADSVVVRLDNFGSSSLDILVQSYINVTTLSEMKEIREQINYAILDIVTQNNSSFAFPSTTVYMSKTEE